MASMTGGEAAIRQLSVEGTEVVFGLPGIHAMPIYDALSRSPELRYIGVRHEQAAAFMSDGYARSTGRVGVCLTSTGPGAMNTAAALSEAYASSIPVLHLTTQIDSRLVDRQKGALHESKNQTACFETVTGRSHRVTEAVRIPDVISGAFQTIRSQRPGPIHIEICADRLSERIDTRIGENRFFIKTVVDPQPLEKAASCLAASTSPVIWAGGGVISSGGFSQILQLAEMLNAPVVTTYMGKGAIPEDHPLSLGNKVLGSDGKGLFQDFMSRSDLLIAVGTRFSALSTGNWSFVPPEKVVHIDIDEKEIGKNYPVEAFVVGDAEAVLSRLVNRLQSRERDFSFSLAPDVDELNRTVDRIVEAVRPKETAIIETIRSILDKDAVLALDMTILGYTASRCFPVYEPRTVLYPSGFGTVGYAFPAALGAKTARPDKQVVALCGDGGFMFHCQELATAVQYGIHVVVVVFNDQGYGALRAVQDAAYGERRFGVDTGNPDFVRLAESFNAAGMRVTSETDLKDALIKALDEQRPVVIEYADWDPSS